ncbi:MAG: hypothetical protein C4332_14360 [Meiothermus sp.]
MKIVMGLFISLILSVALAQLPAPKRSVPTLIITPALQITLYRWTRTVERTAGRNSITLVYRSTQGDKIFVYHHRDLLAHGWTKVSETSKPGQHAVTYQKGGHKASLQVTQSGERVAVTVRQD